MKLTKKSDDNSLLQYPNEIMRKSKYWQFPKSQQLWLHSPIDGSVQKKTNYLLHFRVINLKDFFMNPAMMGSQDLMNSRYIA